MAEELARFESPNVTYLADNFPVFWDEARGCNVRDVDGNIFVDLTAAFAVTAAGHGHPGIVEAITRQAEKLVHGMGDVHPPAVKVKLLRRLAEIAPGELNRTILANSGAEAVEAALKTMAIATGRSRVLAFEGSYHGLTLGALSVSGRADFQRPFAGQLAPLALLTPFPRGVENNPAEDEQRGADALREIEGVLDRAEAEGDPVGGILAECIQGRGGDIVPPASFLPGLRRICDQRGILLILDEIYTGFGRTGRLFACQRWGVTPDLLVVGKALTGGMPFAACIGTDAVMEAWPRSKGEALHTSTFLGHPLGCAAALASMDIIIRGRLSDRAEVEGAYARDRLRSALRDVPGVGEVRGLGLMIGVELLDPSTGEPDPGRAGRVVVGALQQGVLMLSGGTAGNVLSLSPPLVIPRALLDYGLMVIEKLLRERD
jgi:4-aminobutyrate aminotransferase-like enzyme